MSEAQSQKKRVPKLHGIVTYGCHTGGSRAFWVPSSFYGPEAEDDASVIVTDLQVPVWHFLYKDRATVNSAVQIPFRSAWVRVCPMGHSCAVVRLKQSLLGNVQTIGKCLNGIKNAA